ncbi:mitochondrial carrier domain-containing protein [Stachybotrys elegans]|uniref:Mitochondrial carrier domain-containing protein n=1 Tax=Stachybotrys elegans TaxID=80388 RepID=A0A8K0SMC5_9HYPO|nr:mitochondrial carrier domain-containing protein [Stachybotrys elegans]
MSIGRNEASGPAVDFPPGLLPVIPPEDVPDRAPRNNAATAASAAGVRALSAQVVAFYFRAPAKAFFRTRVDYLAYARTVHQARIRGLMLETATDETATRLSVLMRQTWLWMRSTTPGVLTSAIKQEGWGVLTHQVLPPLIANVGVGAVLYTSYLQILGRLHEDSAKASKRIYPPPSPSHTFTAGLMAGALQSFVAAPLDAIQARFDHRDLINEGGRPRSMWSFSAEKLRDIGLRGIFAGWGLSLTKDSLGSAIFFSTFEYVKAQGYYGFVTWYYGGLAQDIVDTLAMKRPTPREKRNDFAIIRPHYAIEPAFLLMAGISASFAQQLVLHPLTHFQVKHWDHLEDLDAKAARMRLPRSPDRPHRRWRMLRAYYHAYQETWAGCAAEAASEGQGVARWLYRGFWWNAIRQVPSTSAGLIIFELIRRKYGFGAEEVRISKDGYDILLH